MNKSLKGFEEWENKIRWKLMDEDKVNLNVFFFLKNDLLYVNLNDFYCFISCLFFCLGNLNIIYK